MERRSKTLVLPFLVLCCLVLFPLASSAPLSRSLRLRNLQHPPSPKLAQQGMVMLQAASRNLDGGGRAAAAARMAVEVNDYPGSGPNNRHDPPKGPGRA